MKCFLSVIAFFVATEPIWADDQTLPQEFGSGSVEITFSPAEFSLSLSVPSADILEFDHRAATDAERTSVAMAISTLSEPLTLFVVPQQAGCTIASANVTLVGETLGQVAESRSVSQFQADYIIQCSDMTELRTIDFAYFDHFERADALRIQTPLSRSLQITRTKRILDVVALQGRD